MNAKINIIQIIIKIIKEIFSIRTAIVFLLTSALMIFIFGRILFFKEMAGFLNICDNIICYARQIDEIEKNFGKIKETKFLKYKSYYDNDFLIEECAIKLKGDKADGIIYARIKRKIGDMEIEKLNIKMKDKLIKLK